MKKLPFPNRITIELTNACNVSCSFCPRQAVDMEIGYMDEKLFKKIIDEAAQHLPVKLVFFFRGESLLHPRFLEYLKYAKEKGLGPIQFASNALALEEQTAEEMLNIGIDFISFSMDTLNEDVYRATRRSGNLSASMKNVIALGEKCRKRKEKGLPAPTLQVSTIELPAYMGEQSDFIAFWKKYVDIVRVYYEHDEKGRFRDRKAEEMLPVLERRQPCRKVFTDLLVYWDGSLALCNYDWSGEAFADINLNSMTIQEVWDSQVYERIRKMHWDDEFMDDIMCRNCEHWRIDYMPEGFLGKMYRRDDD